MGCRKDWSLVCIKSNTLAAADQISWSFLKTDTQGTVLELSSPPSFSPIPPAPIQVLFPCGGSFQLHPVGFLSATAHGLHPTWLTLLVLLRLKTVVTFFKNLFLTRTPIRDTCPPGVPKTIPPSTRFS